MNYHVRGGKKYKAALAKIAKVNLQVRAGVPKGARTTDGQSIPEYAIYNEMGTSRMPARPFMRQTVETHEHEWGKTVESALNYKAIKADGAKRAAGLVGEQMKAHVQQTIQQGKFKPDAPATVDAKRRKGKTEPNHPLVDTGQMLASIISEVMQK
jgi:HK97 gp10 family phage protein